MLRFLIEKEFKQIFRNSFVPKLIIAMPVMMMLVLPWAANQEVKGVKMSVIDNDNSTFSERLIHKLDASSYFRIVDFSPTNDKALNSVEIGDADIILEIQSGFERELVKTGFSKVMISANAVNAMKAGLGSSYLVSILMDYTAELRNEYGGVIKGINPLVIESTYKFNPRLDYKVFMIPALMVMLLTMLAGFLPALNIVGEKETGTIEQINVTPVKRLMFILSKLIPYWIIGFVVLSLCMGLGWLVYGLKPTGSLLTIYLFSSIYVLVVSGLGLIISNYSNTMQQAMFVTFFFVMILLLMSGLFTPVTSMPNWAQKVTIFNPLKYFIQVMRLVYLKGSAFKELLTPFFALCSFAIVFNTWAVISYRKSK